MSLCFLQSRTVLPVDKLTHRHTKIDMLAGDVLINSALIWLLNFHNYQPFRPAYIISQSSVCTPGPWRAHFTRPPRTIQPFKQPLTTTGRVNCRLDTVSGDDFITSVLFLVMLGKRFCWTIKLCQPMCRTALHQ